MKKYIAIILIVLFICCKKDGNYAGKSSPFYVGELVKLNGFNPQTSFVPYNCCNCPCRIDSVYTEGTAKEWYYNIVDLNNTTLTNVAGYLLKGY